MSFENVPCKALYSGKKGVWNGSQTMWDSFQTLTIIVENFYFLCFWNPSCVRKRIFAYTCFRPRTQTTAHICGSRVTLVILFPKIDFYSFKKLYFPFQHSSSQFDIWWGSKLALYLRVRALLGNGGSNPKGYKMRCLHISLIWFMSFANGIKRIRDKTFCFDVWLGPNPPTRHTSRIHRAGCNSRELHGIRMSEVPLLLLGKWATIGLLSQNLFCHLQANGEWLTIIE